MRALAVALAALFVALIAFAVCRDTADAAEPIVTDLRVDAPGDLTVGDLFHILITVEADSGTSVALPPGALPPALELTRQPEVTSRSKGSGRVEIRIDLEVAAFASGEIPIPPVAVAHRDASGVTGVIQSPVARVTVQSVLPPTGDLTPRDLKAQAEIGTAPTNWAAIAGVAVAVGLITVVALVLWRRSVLRRRRLLEAIEPEPVVLSPEDRARAILDRVAREALAAGNHDVFYGEVAVTMRNYLTERFGFPAFALTTRELQDQMLVRGMDRWQARLTGGLLTQCDAVVYARYRPAAERADADLTAAYEIVEMSRPPTVEEEEPVLA